MTDHHVKIDSQRYETFNIVLKKAAEAIGDEGIPDISDSRKSVARWIAVFVGISGFALLGVSIYMVSKP